MAAEDLSDDIYVLLSVPEEGVWKKSSWSAENGNCVSVSRLPDDHIGVRHSKDYGPGCPVLAFPFAGWASFIAGVQEGDFDLP